MILLTHSYTSGNATRQREVDDAASINSTSHALKQIISLDGNERWTTLGERCSLARDCFRNEVRAIASSDISFDRSFHDVEEILACLGDPDPVGMKVYCSTGNQTFDDETMKEAPPRCLLAVLARWLARRRLS
jgi:hypothetical protein